MIEISENPYRILGITCDAKFREIQKNFSKINSYLKVKREVTLPFDNVFFGSITRNGSIVKKSKNSLQLDDSKLINSLFWIIISNDIDSVAVKYLINGDFDKSQKIWSKQVEKSSINSKNYSFYNNLSTLMFVKGDYKSAIKIKCILIDSSYIKLFSKKVCDENYLINKNDLIDNFINKTINGLITQGLSNDIIIKSFSETSKKNIEKVYNYFLKDPISKLEQNINKAIDLSSQINSKKTNKTKNINSGTYGRALMIDSKVEIKKIEKILGVNDFRFQIYADKLAGQLEQCGVMYFNETGNDLDYLDVYKYALLIARSEKIKNKLKEALKHSREIQKNENSNYVIDLITKFKRKRPATIGYLNNARILIDQCKPYLEKIKLEKGELDELYINLSRGLASVVMDGIIKVNNIDNSKVDKAIKIYNKSPYNNFNY